MLHGMEICPLLENWALECLVLDPEYLSPYLPVFVCLVGRGLATCHLSMPWLGGLRHHSFRYGGKPSSEPTSSAS